MKKIFTFIYLLISFLVDGQKTKYINRNGEFIPNELVYTFGKNVKLRSEPNTNSETILKIPIAEKLIVLEKLENKLLYNGIDWNWYKVNYNNKIGYILGGLLSQDTKKIDDNIYLISLRKINEEFYILTRLVKNEKYVEHLNLFNTEICFSIKTSDNKGVTNVKNMIYIDYTMEGCGINGGGYYLFNNNEKLKKAIELFRVKNSGIYGYNEEVIFPNEIGGKQGKLILKINKLVINEDTNEEVNKENIIELTWIGKELKPKK